MTPTRHSPNRGEGADVPSKSVPPTSIVYAWSHQRRLPSIEVQSGLRRHDIKSFRCHQPARGKAKAFHHHPQRRGGGGTEHTEEGIGFRPNGAQGCSHGWSAARRQAGGAEPVKRTTPTRHRPGRSGGANVPSKSVLRLRCPSRNSHTRQSRLDQSPKRTSTARNKFTSVPPALGHRRGLYGRLLVGDEFAESVGLGGVGEDFGNICEYPTVGVGPVGDARIQ